MVPTFSPTAVVAAPTYAKLRQTETLAGHRAARSARFFLANPSWAALNIAFVYPKPSSFVGRLKYRLR